MSAINIIRMPDAVYLFTDAASYAGDGTLGEISQKVWPIAHLDCAVACRGPALWLPLMASRIGARFRTFEELVAGLVDFLPGALRHVEIFGACEFGPGFELYLAGWSHERGRGESYFLSSADRYGVTAWELRELAEASFAPCDAELEEALTAGRVVLPETWGPLDLGLYVMERQRRMRASHPGLPEPVHGVGGFAQATTIMPGCISTTILARWPEDHPGEKIAPREAVALAA